MEAKTTTDGLRLLGLARRAGAVVPGTDAVRRAIRDGSVRLLILAEDAAPGQRQKIERTLGNQPIPRVFLGDRVTLGAAVGRGPLAAVAVTGAPFAAELKRRLVAAAAPESVEE